MSDVVVITGASAGVGRAVASEFARRGAKVAILARGAQGLADTRRELERLGADAVLDIAADVADAAAVEAAADRVEAELGPIDIWVNSAMVTIYAPVHEITAAEYRQGTEVTYLGTVHGTQSALKRMRGRNRGTVVQVGSALAYRSIPLQSMYCGAKAGIRGFTDSLRSELIHDRSRIRLTMVQLPAVNTPQFDWALNKLGRKVEPLPPIFQPEAVARAIVHAAYHPRREYYIGLSALKAAIANKAIPGILDHILASKAYKGEETSMPSNDHKPGNLFASVAGARTRGRFDDRARSSGPVSWASANPAFTVAAAAALGVGALAVSYFIWCPEAPRFDGRPLRRQWWQRQRWHARHG